MKWRIDGVARSFEEDRVRINVQEDRRGGELSVALKMRVDDQGSV